MANEQGQHQYQPTKVAEPPKQPRAVSHTYKYRVNAKAGLNGAFNGVCQVFEGDEFVRTVHPYLKRGKNGTPDQLIDRRPPTWADVIDEYEVPVPVKLVPKVGRKVESPKP